MPVRRMSPRRSQIIIVALLLSACATAPQRTGSSGGAGPTPARAGVNLSGYSASFQQGYAEGCESVRQPQRRDVTRYGLETDYTMGWNDGYSICGRR